MLITTNYNNMRNVEKNVTIYKFYWFALNSGYKEELCCGKKNPEILKISQLNFNKDKSNQNGH